MLLSRSATESVGHLLLH
uniref:Uncharacterized protein n=1 Tax=Rhizophora mucronata TaxID=61149 RepID=A0A2P2IXH6_RHIMU